MDYIFRWLELRFLAGEQLPLFGPGGSENWAGRELDRHRAAASQFFHTNGDAPPCVVCGGLMKPSGTCSACVVCGQTSGCSWSGECQPRSTSSIAENRARWAHWNGYLALMGRPKTMRSSITGHLLTDRY